MAYLEPCVTLAYSKPCHIQNPGIFRAQDISRTPSRHILAYSQRCVKFPYWKSCHILKFFIFRILSYLGPEANSEFCLFIYDSSIILTFFFTLKELRNYSLCIICVWSLLCTVRVDITYSFAKTGF